MVNSKSSSGRKGFLSTEFLLQEIKIKINKLVIFVMFLILFQSIKLSIFGMIPNIIASTFILGTKELLPYVPATPD